MQKLPSRTVKIVFFGDSISFGQGVSIDKTWVTMCSQLIDKNCETQNQKSICINPSVNGNTTRMALERMPHDVQSFTPDIAVVQFGLNDANYWASDNGLARVSLAAFEANIHEIIDRLRSCGATAIILNTNHLTDLAGIVEQKISKLAPYSYRDNIKKYNDIIRKTDGCDGVRVNDIEDIWEKVVQKRGARHGLLLEDGVHLSASAHELYRDAVILHLRAAVSHFFQMQNA